MLTGKEFAEKCVNVAKNYTTTYVWGGVGMPITEQTIADKVAQYPLNRSNGYEAKARALIGKHAWMFDCVCLLKSILWGWRGDWSQYFGGAKYASNGVPDISADDMIRRCRDVSTSFSNISIGEALWLPGHIGVYIGDGLAVECTPAFAGGVQITAVGNIGYKPGYPFRTWVRHGKLPYVNYAADKADFDGTKNGRIIVNGTEKSVDLVLRNGTNYVDVRDIFTALGLSVDTVTENGATYVKIRDFANAFGYQIGNQGNIAVLTTK